MVPRAPHGAQRRSDRSVLRRLGHHGRHVGSHGRDRPRDATYRRGRAGEGRPGARGGYLLHHLAQRRQRRETEPVQRGCGEDPLPGPRRPPRWQASAVDGGLLSLGRARDGLLPLQGRVGHPQGHVHARGRGGRRPRHGRDQRRALLGRVGRALPHDGEDAGRGE